MLYPHDNEAHGYYTAVVMTQWIASFDDVFVPEEKHSISTGAAGAQVWGGVIHAVGVLATGEPPVYAQTMFQKPADWREPITIDKQSHGPGLHVVRLAQNSDAISQTVVVSSTKPEPSIHVKSPIEMIDMQEEEWKWGWGTGSDLMAHMTGYFRDRNGRRINNARMWFRDHDMDLGVVASLADSGSWYMVPNVGAFGRTKILTSHFTNNMPLSKTYMTHTLEGRAAGGIVFSRVDQYDEQGQPACLTRGVFKVDTEDDSDWSRYV